MEKKNPTVIKEPISLIKSLLDEHPEMLKDLAKVGEYVKALLEDETKIPCINETQLEKVQPNTLVKFRGMVQDMLDPEFYLGKYFTRNTNTGEKTTRIGCFTDTGCKQSPLEIIDFDAEENVTLERQTYYCVPVPGENQWIKDSYKQAFNNDPAIMQEERNNAQKRRLDEDEIVMNEEKMETEISSKTSNSPEKKLRENNTESAEGSQQKGAEAKPKRKVDYARNFPLSEEKGNAAFVKMYSKTTSLKLNDVAEFICILSVDPHFAQSSMQEEMETNEVTTWHEFNMEEDRAHCPPPSLVPRLHCLYYNKLEELNPNVRNNHTDYECASKELTSIRADLIQTLKGLLGGDGIAAEYLLLHLISSVYGRVGAMCVGKFALNLFKFPNSGFCERLYQFIEKIVPKSHYLPMSLNNLNNKQFIPSKDFQANRLTSGVLQLSSGTNLILDETQMEPGKLDTDGVKNLTALGNLIQWQKLEYDFTFNRLDIETNVNVLVLSEGKSLLKCDCQLPINFEDSTEQTNATSEKLLQKFRYYLSNVRQMKYELTEEVQKALEDDFVEMRKEDSKAMNADAFYVLLTTARYLAISHGQSTLSAALWTRVKELDADLRKRLR